jgi:hypothetical protein
MHQLRCLRARVSCSRARRGRSICYAMTPPSFAKAIGGLANRTSAARGLVWRCWGADQDIDRLLETIGKVEVGQTGSATGRLARNICFQNLTRSKLARLRTAAVRVMQTIRPFKLDRGRQVYRDVVASRHLPIQASTTSGGADRLVTSSSADSTLSRFTPRAAIEM